MNSINSFIIGFCGSCVLLGFLYMLCPTGNMSIPVRYIFCLCFLCSVIGAAISIPSPDFSEFDKSKSTEVLTEQNVSATAQAVFGTALKNENIFFRKIMVETNKTGDGSIVISRVTVYTDEPPQRIREAICSDDYEVVVLNE